jgi:hypothetical protein
MPPSAIALQIRNNPYLGSPGSGSQKTNPINRLKNDVHGIRFAKPVTNQG